MAFCGYRLLELTLMLMPYEDAHTLWSWSHWSQIATI